MTECLKFLTDDYVGILISQKVFLKAAVQEHNHLPDIILKEEQLI